MLWNTVVSTNGEEKGVNPDNPLLKWHQANLELPSGTGFHDLGYTSNGVATTAEVSWTSQDLEIYNGLIQLKPGSRINVSELDLKVKMKSNATTQLTITPSNPTGNFVPVVVDLIPKNNLRGLSEGVSNFFGEL